VKILIWVGVATIQKIFGQINIFDWGLPLANWCHAYAFKLMEAHPSDWNWFYEAILIGRDDNLRSQETLQSFFTLGLYHLIVVSGSHVLALEKIIQTCLFFLSHRQKKVITLIFLIGFSLVNRLQASCVRAFISWLVMQKKSTKIVLQGDFQFIVTCLCLILQPSWLNSLSFQLSCGATLGLALASSLKLQGFIAKKLASTFLCAAVTSPLILCVQPCLSWLIIPANTFAMPLFEGVLMPISLINVTVGAWIHPLLNLTEKVFVWVFGLSDFFAKFEKPLLCLDERKLANWGLIYLFSVYLAWRLFLPLFFRAQFWQNQKLLPQKEWSSGM
jgi:ComEC/Rec2-related protein